MEDPKAYGKFSDCLHALALQAQAFGQISVRGPPLKIGGDVELIVLHPFERVEEPKGDKNDDSVVVKLRYKEVNFIFTGDASAKVEREILKEGIGSDVLKLGHHGSRTSSDPEFLKKVSEGTENFYAVISSDDEDGKGKTYGHPHQETLERLREIKGAQLYRTDLHGDIVFTTDGSKINVKTQKRVYYPEDLWEPGRVTLQ